MPDASAVSSFAELIFAARGDEQDEQPIFLGHVGDRRVTVSLRTLRHAVLTLCDELDLASINRIPLAMGMLSGQWTRQTQLPQDDRRRAFFAVEEFLQDLERLQSMRQMLTRDGRSYVQAALGWIWARSPRTIPVPGFRTVEHIEEDAQAMHYGPLDEEQMAEIESLLGR